jgi:hypothetical protein
MSDALATAIATTLEHTTPDQLATDLGVHIDAIALWGVGIGAPSTIISSRAILAGHTLLAFAMDRARTARILATHDFGTSHPSDDAENGEPIHSPKPTKRRGVTSPIKSRKQSQRGPTHTVTPRRPVHFDAINELGMGDALALAADYDMSADELFGVGR